MRAAGLASGDAAGARPVALALAAHVALLALGLAGFLGLDAGPARVASLLPLWLGMLGIATVAHTATHGAVGRRRRANDILAFFGGVLVSGISFTFWRDKHVRRHHAAPNVRGIDPDHDFAPWFALTDADLAGRSRLARAWYRRQRWIFPLALAVMIPRMKVEGWLFACRALRGPERRLALVDLGVLVASNAAWWGLPLLVAGPADSLALNLFREVGLSLGFFAMFAPSHIPRDAVCFGERVREDFVLQQTATTLNYRAGRLTGFFLSGLQYQIEHHLLPELSHVHYARVAPLVEATCRRHGYPYRVQRWGEGLRETLRVLAAPKPVANAPAGGR